MTAVPIDLDCTQLETTYAAHVLVVDDNEMNREVLTLRLQRQGYAVDTAVHGADALAKLNNGAFDLILLDIMMPKMNGFQVLEAMRDSPALREIPVIVVSAMGDTDSIARCMELGAEDYLFKPFDPVILRVRVQASLDKKRLRDSERRCLHELEQKKQQLDALLNVVVPLGAELTSEQRLSQIFEKALTAGKTLCRADAAALYLLDTHSMPAPAIVCNDTLKLYYDLINTQPGVPQPAAAPEAISALMRAVQTGEALISGQPATVWMGQPQSLIDASGRYLVRSLLTVPLKSAAGVLLGILQYANPLAAQSGAVIPFTPAQQHMVEALSALAAAAVQGYVREAVLQLTIDELSANAQGDQTIRRMRTREITQSEYFQQLRAQLSEF